MLKARFYKSSRNSHDFGLPGIMIGEYVIDSVSINRSMRETTHFNFSIPLQQIDVSFDAKNTEITHCKIFKETTELVHGIVGTYEKNDETLEVECEDVLFLMSQAAARPYPM